MTKKIATEWYREQQFQNCPRAYKIEFIDNVERRQMRVNQAGSHWLRSGLRKIVARQPRENVAIETSTGFLDECRVRGLDTLNQFRSGSRMQDVLFGLLSRYDVEWRDTHDVTTVDRVIVEEFMGKTSFMSDPVAFLQNRAGDWWLLYPKVTSTWTETKAVTVHREFRLLSEFYALMRWSGTEPAGAIVQPFSLNNAKREEDLAVPFDRGLVEDWAQQIAAQVELSEHRERVLAVADVDPELGKLSENQAFPQHRQNCDRPYPCPFVPVCWGELRDADPLLDARYRPRVLLGWEANNG